MSRVYLIIFTILSIGLFSSNSFGKETVIIKYKKYEKFDLGELEIKGSIIAPGDLSTSNLDVRKFSLQIYERKKFDDHMATQLRSLR